MALTKSQLKKLQDIINRRFLAFTYEALGESALTGDELEMLKRVGLIKESVRHLTGDAHTLGKIVSLLERGRARDLTYEEVLRAAKKMKPLTSVEKKAMEFASAHTGQYIKGIKDLLVKEVGAESARASGAALRAVQENVSEAIANRETRSELKTRLFHAIDNRERDWMRVAHTEMNDAIQNGIYANIRDESDEREEQLVYKRPNPDACAHCKRVFLEADGFTPKVFRLKDLASTNVGLKARNWKPTIGSVHPWCQCQLHVVPDGYSFKTVRVVIEPFKKGGVEYKRGQVIEESVYETLGEGLRAKVGYDATLTYSGETAKPSTRKSMSEVSENGYEQECVCEY